MLLTMCYLPATNNDIHIFDSPARRSMYIHIHTHHPLPVSSYTFTYIHLFTAVLTPQARAPLTGSGLAEVSCLTLGLTNMTTVTTNEIE